MGPSVKIAAAIQQACAEQRHLDNERIMFLLAFERGVYRPRPHDCSVLTCERARFWRDRYSHAQAEADRYARQLRDAGHRPQLLHDGNQAGHAHLDSGR